jgi:prohibitin 1
MRSLILITIILLLTTYAHRIAARRLLRRSEQGATQDTSKSIGGLVAFTVVAFWIILILVFAVAGKIWVEVGPAETMTVYDPFRGGIQHHDYGEGWRIIAPWATTRTFSKRLQEYTMSAINNEGAILGDDSMTCQTKEGLAIKIDATTVFRIPAGGAHKIWRQVGPEFVRVIVRPYTRNVVRLVVSKYGIMEVYSNASVDAFGQPGIDFYVGQRQNIEREIQDTLKKQFADKGLDLVMFLLRNVTYDAPQFESAIYDKQIAQQEVVTKQFEAEAAQIRAQAQVVRAEGEAKGIQLKAQALSIDPRLIDLEWVNQIEPDEVWWLPRGATPFIQLPQSARNTEQQP